VTVRKAHKKTHNSTSSSLVAAINKLSNARVHVDVAAQPTLASTTLMIRACVRAWGACVLQPRVEPIHNEFEGALNIFCHFRLTHVPARQKSMRHIHKGNLVVVVVSGDW
jgi:hypothetical protein